MICMSSLNVVHDDNSIIGLLTNYEADGQTVSTQTLGTTQATKNEVISFQKGEYICSISGRSGSIIDRLVITTNIGKTYAFGGKGGSDFTYPVPIGKRIVAFHGGVGTHLNSLGVYYH